MNISPPNYIRTNTNKLQPYVKLKPVHALAAGLLLGLGGMALPAFASDMTSGATAASHYLVKSNSTRSVRSGVTAFRKGQFEKSAVFSRRALKQGLKKSRKSAAYGNLCAALAVQDQMQPALAACDRAIEADGKNWQAYANRAVIYSLQNQADKASSDVRKASVLSGEASEMARVETFVRDKAANKT